MQGKPYYKTSEFWATLIYLLGAIASLVVTALAEFTLGNWSDRAAGYFTGSVVLVVAVILVYGFLRLVHWKNLNPDDKSPLGKLFQYGLVGTWAGPLALFGVFHESLRKLLPLLLH